MTWHTGCAFCTTSTGSLSDEWGDCSWQKDMAFAVYADIVDTIASELKAHFHNGDPTIDDN